MLWITLLLFVLILISCIADSQHMPYAKQFLLISMILIMGLRYDVGRDYPNYVIIYNEPYSYKALAVEPIWQLFNHVFRSLGFRSRIFFFLTAAATIYLYYKGIKKMTSHFYIAMALFIVLGFYYESANIIRQFLAMAILFYGYRDYLDGKIFRFILCGLTAALFHSSALIILPVILISRVRIPLVLLALSVIISFVCGTQLLDIAINVVLPSIGNMIPYHYTVDDYPAGYSSGLLKVVYIVLTLTIIWLLASKKVDSKMTAMLNMVVFGVVLYNTFFLFMPARRLYLYFFPFIVVLIPECMKYFTKASSKIVMCIITFVFLLFLIKSNIGIPYAMDLNFM